jgi:valyl-tRNA synthetase
MQDLMELIGGIRSVRAEMNIDPRRALDAALVFSSQSGSNLVSDNIEKIRSLARLNRIDFAHSIPAKFLRGVWKSGEFGVDVYDAIDLKAETERLKKELTRVQDEIDKLLKKLNNQDFMSRAPEEVIAENRKRHSESIEMLHKLESNLSSLPQE